MNYSELIQLYFDRSTAMQNYWNLYVLVVGGILAFSSLRKQHAAVPGQARFSGCPANSAMQVTRPPDQQRASARQHGRLRGRKFSEQRP